MHGRGNRETYDEPKDGGDRAVWAAFQRWALVERARAVWDGIRGWSATSRLKEGVENKGDTSLKSKACLWKFARHLLFCVCFLVRRTRGTLHDISCGLELCANAAKRHISIAPKAHYRNPMTSTEPASFTLHLVHVIERI
jgi:hypothetical protein